jgi:UDP-GlcNAc:undecaprenyl-phosphate/decaprenyl-phosphate GlcNAc-1-phosphate transferase
VKASDSLSWGAIMWLEAMAIAAFCSLVLTWSLARNAARLGMVDHPGGHKHHRDPVAMVGGPAIALAMIIALAFVSIASLRTQWVLIVALASMLLVGLADDRFLLSPRVRLAAQSAAALLMACVGNVLLSDLGALLDGAHPLHLGWAAIPLTVFCAVGVINACNMSDGMDGVAGGMTALALAGASFLAYGHASAAQLPIVGSALGGVLGFLAMNMPLMRSARAYLGDGGSLFLGTLLAWVLVSFSQGPDRAFSPVAALWLYAVPLIDTVSVMWRRMSEGRSPLQPDQRHLHHMMLRTGLSVRRAWMLLMLIAAAGVGLAIVATRAAWPEPIMAVAFLAVAFAYHFMMRHADRRGRLLGCPVARDVASAASLHGVQARH